MCEIYLNRYLNWLEEEFEEERRKEEENAKKELDLQSQPKDV